MSNFASEAEFVAYWLGLRGWTKADAIRWHRFPVAHGDECDDPECRGFGMEWAEPPCEKPDGFDGTRCSHCFDYHAPPEWT